MNAMPAHWRLGLHGVLLITMLFYVLLPYFGMAWHNVVPEHDHWHWGMTQRNFKFSPDLLERVDAPNICASCGLLSNGETLIHAFNPISALQFFSIVMSLSSLILLTIPAGFSLRLTPSPLFLKTPYLLPLDPPPTVA